MNKNDLIAEVADDTGLSKTDAAKELEVLKAQLAELTARIDRLSDVPTVSRERQ